MDQPEQGAAPTTQNSEIAQPTQPPAQEPRQASAAPRNKGLLLLACFVLLVGGGVLATWLLNEITLQKPLQAVLTSDSRNQAVTAKAHFDGWIDTQSVVFDISEVSGNASQMDVLRVFLQYAKAQKDHHYKRIFLAGYGQKKFIMPGDYFQQLGIEYDSQNPVYTMRTIAHHVTSLDGAHPFPEYEGGLFGVLGKEMDEFSDLNKQWYLNDYIARHK